MHAIYLPAVVKTFMVVIIFIEPKNGFCSEDCIWYMAYIYQLNEE